MTRKDARARAVEFPKEWLFLYEYCQVVWCPSGSGSDGFFVVNVYLPTHDHNREIRAEVVEGIFHMISTFRSPTCVCGDFQDPPYSNTSIVEALCKGGWSDAHHEIAAAKGIKPKFTFSARKKGWGDSDPRGKSRIDLFLLSPTFLPLLQDADVFYSAPFPGHAVVSITLNMDVVCAEAFTLVPHKKWDLPPQPKSEEEWEDRESRCLPILVKHSADLIALAQSCDTEGLWSAACTVATEMLNCVCDSLVPCTRGLPPKFKPKKFAQTHSSPHSEQSRLVKLKKRIREASIQNQRILNKLPADTNTCKATVSNICRALNAFGFPYPKTLPQPGTDQMESWLCSVMGFCESRQAQDLKDSDKSKLNNWKTRMRTSTTADRKQIHRWIKDESPSYPRCFKRPDGTITANPQEMLDMVSDRMEAIYNTHKSKDIPQTIQAFKEKYAASIEALRFAFECPEFNHYDLFQLAQKRPSHKASGLDGWLTVELKCLPPCGWYPFMLVMKLAESSGVWPQIVRLVSVSTISKGLGNFDPSLMRAIGVSSVVYSIWSSLRFRQLTTWHVRIAPPTLYGGLQKRKASDSELAFSTDVHGSEEEFCAVLVDRYKCFDLIIPKVALEIARALGLPQPIFRAACAFYDHQIKFFKIGAFFGRRVMSTNAAVQGCSLSILMINAMYSVLAHHVSGMTPEVQFASFVDDCKLWTINQNTEQLQIAFSELSAFDKCIGQQINDGKSIIFTKYQKRAARFLRDVGRGFKTKKNVKSLGFSHTIGKQKNAKIQNQRVEKAIATAARVAALPLSDRDRALHVHANVHAQWVYGTELQPPSKHQFKRLRTAVVRVFHKRRNCMRCPFHFMVTSQDVFLDPWAKWVLHNLRWLRSEFWRDKARLQADLAEIRRRMRAGQANAFDPTRGGRINILGYIFRELRWRISDNDVFLIHREFDTDLKLVLGSTSSFRIETARSVRTWLLRQAPQRQDFGSQDSPKHVDIFLTRFLLDTTFAERRDLQILQRFLERLPKPFDRVRSILKTLLAGSVFTGKRLYAAGIAKSDRCSSCRRSEDHSHLFKFCNLYCKTRPSKESICSMSNDCWHSGIIYESPRVRALRTSLQSAPSSCDPSSPDKVCCPLAFIDGSCFYEKWGVLSSGASAVIFENGHSVSQELPGLYPTSQRAEIGALLLALKHSSGDIRIGSDCAGVVNTFAWLAANKWEQHLLSTVDNADLWSAVVECMRSRPNDRIACFKVKAHISENSSLQPRLWTELNSKADSLAKSIARKVYLSRIDMVHDEICDAVELQSHLISTLWQRFSSTHLPISKDIQPEHNGAGTSIGRPTCAMRIWGKQTCPAQQTSTSSSAGPLNSQAFLDFVRKGVPVPESLQNSVCRSYPRYAAVLRQSFVFTSLPRDILLENISWGSTPRNIPGMTAVIQFIKDGEWYLPNVDDNSRMSWIELVCDFLVNHGFCGGFLTPGMPMSRLTRRMKTYMCKAMQACGVALACVPKTNIHREFLGGDVAGIVGRKKVSYPNALWALFLSDQTRFVLNGSRQANAHWIPNFHALLQ